MNLITDFLALIGLIACGVWIYNTFFISKKPVKDSEDVKKIIELINQGKNLFITGGAGTGKSYILNILRQRYRIAVTSTTGISAISIKGQTIHSWSGIGIANQEIENIVKKILSSPALERQIKYCRLLAIDEISMLDGYTFDYLNEVLKKVRENDEPFGGIKVLLFGDFLQLPPVEEKTKGYCFNSKAWTELSLSTVVLNKIYRQEELSFVETLNNARHGIVTQDDYELLAAREVTSNYDDSNILHLFSKKDQANHYNTVKLMKLNSFEMCYTSKDVIYTYRKDGTPSDNIIVDNPNNLNKYHLGIFQTLERDCRASNLLKLKKGCRVILLKNIDFKRNLVNGSTGAIAELGNDFITIDFDCGSRYTMTSKDKYEYWSEGVLKATREQYPLSLAYGVTIHKSQGMTLGAVVIDFNKIFAFGQAYVALSRVKTLKGLYLKGFAPNKIVASDKAVKFYNDIESLDNTQVTNENMCSQRGTNVR